MKPNQIAAQLYTCRDLLKTPADIAKTLRRVRSAGYQAVQISGMGPIPEEELNKILDGEGLVCCATHEPGHIILNDPHRVVERLHKLRCRHTAYPFPAGIDFSNADGVASFIRQLDHAGSVLAAAGLTLSYHNHQHEFRKLGGRLILDLIYERTNPAHLKGELDTFWVHYGGGDNIEWCRKLSGRLPLIHLKDYMITADNSHAFCEIGHGNLSFKKIIPAAEQAGCEWFIVEQDTTPGDPVESLAASYRWLVGNICS